MTDQTVKIVEMTEKERVELRNGMLMCLEDAIVKADAGDKQPLRDALNKIGNDYRDKGYSIMKVKKSINIRGVRYTATDNVIVVLENGLQMFTIFKDKETGKGWIDLDNLDLLTREEQKELFKQRVAGEGI